MSEGGNSRHREHPSAKTLGVGEVESGRRGAGEVTGDEVM